MSWGCDEGACHACDCRLIVPAYYEKTLMGKVKRDDESEEMLDMIYRNVLYDFGMCYGLGSVPNSPTDLP